MISPEQRAKWLDEAPLSVARPDRIDAATWCRWVDERRRKIIQLLDALTALEAEQDRLRQEVWQLTCQLIATAFTPLELP